MNALVIEDERELEHRYAAYLDGRLVGHAGAILVRETILAPHVEVEPDKHDLGIGSLLVRRVYDDARAEGHTVLALCPFARRWADLHPAYRDVARRPRAGELAAVGSLIAAERTMRLLHGG
ncbi:MAG TPA: GNAT family N-acetyltransferase [Actinospica sp.]|nr:GNAT family N-acetyltransferase [Actinospica sp.]